MMQWYLILFFALVATCQANSLNRQPVARKNVPEKGLYKQSNLGNPPNEVPDTEGRFGAHANAAAAGYLGGHVGGHVGAHLGGHVGGHLNGHVGGHVNANAAAAAAANAYAGGFRHAGGQAGGYPGLYGR